ncbi:MAG: acyl-CoA dehydrogenase family protein [Candidatus Bathyarchaeia archaeon]
MTSKTASEYEAVKRAAQQFAEAELGPRASVIDEASQFPLEKLPQMTELGFLGVNVASEFAGAGMDTLCFVALLEETAKQSASTAVCLLVHNAGVATVLQQYASPALQKAFLNRLTAGESLGAFALSDSTLEPTLKGASMRAQHVDGHYVLEGEKVFVVNATMANVFMVCALLEDKHPVLFIASKDEGGLEVGSAQRLMGLRGAGIGNVAFRNCRLRETAIVGERSGSSMVLVNMLKSLQLGAAAIFLGIAQASLDVSLAYANQRFQFGRPIIDFGAVRDMLVSAQAEVRSARSLLFETAGRWKSVSKRLWEDVEHVGRAAEKAVLRSVKVGVKVHGGYGYIRDLPVERYARDAQVMVALASTWTTQGFAKA